MYVIHSDRTHYLEQIRMHKVIIENVFFFLQSDTLKMNQHLKQHYYLYLYKN